MLIWTEAEILGFWIGTKSFLQQIKEKEVIENKNNDGYKKIGQHYGIIFSGIIWQVHFKKGPKDINSDREKKL